VTTNPPQLYLRIVTIRETLLGETNDLCPLALIGERLKFIFGWGCVTERPRGWLTRARRQLKIDRDLYGTRILHACQYRL
jgi:hypothetical protein